VEVVVGKRVRDFSQYAEPLGRDFVSKLADGWRAFADQCSEESERSYWHHNSRFLNFLSNDDRLEALREFFSQRARFKFCAGVPIFAERSVALSRHVIKR